MGTQNNHIVKIVKALAHRSRLRMLEEIARRGKVTCTEVGEIFDLAQPTISHHLRLLIDAGLVYAEKDGRYSNLTVNKEALKELTSYISETVAF